MSQSIYKYGEDITWSLPLAFEFDLIWGAIYRHMQVYGIDLPRINAYGCPNCLWSGGRVARLRHEIGKEELKCYFDYHAEINSTLTFTFTSASIVQEELNDSYCNYLLDIGAEYGAHFIVFDDRLKDHIRKKHPDAYIVSSIIKPTFRYQGPRRVEDPTPEGEAAYYNELLKEYDLVVVRPEFSKYVLKNNPDLIDDLSRIEVLINQQCPFNCPNAPNHYKIIDMARKPEVIANAKDMNINCPLFYTPHEKFYLNTLCHTNDTLMLLAKAGVRHFKLRGRGEGTMLSLVGMFIYMQIFNTDGVNNLIFFNFANRALRYEQEYYSDFLYK